jgi:hypothetical protein
VVGIYPFRSTSSFLNSSRRDQQLTALGVDELVVQEQSTLTDQIQDRRSHICITTTTSYDCKSITLAKV